MAYDDLLEKAAPKSQATTGFWGNLQKKKDAATLRKAETTSATTGGFLIKPTEKLTIGDKENIAKKPMVSAYDKLKTNKMDLDLFGIDSEKEVSNGKNTSCGSSDLIPPLAQRDDLRAEQEA